MRPRYLAFSIAAALSLALDQAAKAWARHALAPIYPHVKTVISGYWDFRYSENPGAAFGFLRHTPGAQWLFVIVAVGIAIGAVFYLRRAELRHPLSVAAAVGLVVGGALGNAIDRVVFGHVTDFVVWKIGTHEWDTFNVADAALVVGIAVLVLATGRAGGRGAKPKTARAA
jgi:lipoprotein signal peptidase